MIGYVWGSTGKVLRVTLIDDFHGRRAANAPSARPHRCLIELCGLGRYGHALSYLKNVNAVSPVILRHGQSARNVLKILQN